MRTFFIILSIVGVWIAGYGYYLQRKLDPLVNAPGVTLVPTRFILDPQASVVRHIQLGFAHFDVPSSVQGEPVRGDDSLFVTLADGEPPFPINIGPPLLQVDEDTTKLLAGFNNISREPVNTLFEFNKRALETQPFSVWSAMIDRRKAAASAVLLMMKSLVVHDTVKLELFDTPQLGASINYGHKMTVVRLFDKGSNVVQEFFGQPSFIDHAFISTILRSYHFTSTAKTDAEWKEEARAAGIQSRIFPKKEVPLLPEDPRHQAIVDEIMRRRRAQNNN